MGLDESDTVSLVAFIVSLVALLVSFLQFTQSTFLTAEGSRRCKPSVIGKWSKLAHKQIIWSELRFEMTFTSPKLLLLDLDDRESVRTVHPAGPASSTVNDGSYNELQYVHAQNAVVNPKRKVTWAAAHVLSWNTLPYNIEYCWERNQQTDGSPSKWIWLRAIGNVIVSLINTMFCVTNSYHEAGLGRDIGISWDALLRHIYLYQSFDRRLHVVNATTQFVDALTEQSMRHAADMQEQGDDPAEKALSLPSQGNHEHGTFGAVILERHSWDLLPPEISRPTAQAELGAILVFAQRLGMRWREIDIIRGSLRAEGNGCSITSNTIPGFGIVLQFNQSRRFQPVQMINNRKVDKLMCGIVPGVPELGLDDVEIVSDNRDAGDCHHRWIDGMGFGRYIHDTRKFRPYWSQTLLNDGLAFYAPFLPTEGSASCRAPNPFGFDGGGLVAITEWADAVQLLRVKLRERHKLTSQWCPTAWPIELMNRLHNECEADFFHRGDALRHKDLISLGELGTSQQEYGNLRRLADMKRDYLSKVRAIHEETTHYFCVLQRSVNEEQAATSSAYLSMIQRPSPNGKLRYIDLFRAHIRMQADAIRGHDDVIKDQIGSIRARVTANGDYKAQKPIDNPIVAIVHQLEPSGIVKKLRDQKAYTEVDISDEQIEEAWWMFIVRGISWRMGCELTGPNFVTVAPASLSFSDMPVWLM